MHAILITEKNMPTILDRLPLGVPEQLAITFYLNHNVEWYLITGYYTRRGVYDDWAIIPASVLKQTYEHDADKIKTDWDQIIRK